MPNFFPFTEIRRERTEAKRNAYQKEESIQKRKGKRRG